MVWTAEFKRSFISWSQLIIGSNESDRIKMRVRTLSKFIGSRELIIDHS